MTLKGDLLRVESKSLDLVLSDMRNWAGNLTYAAEDVVRPSTVEEAQELIAAAPVIRALGTRHSFSHVADAAWRIAFD